MAVKIRLMRIGAKKRPFYRIVAIDESKKRNGTYLELLGTYNPISDPKEINLKQELIDKWLKLGAQPSSGFLRVIGKAKQKPPRKPKKEKAQPKEEVAAKTEAVTPEADAETEQATATDQSEPAATTEEATPTEETATETVTDENSSEPTVETTPEAEPTVEEEK